MKIVLNSRDNKTLPALLCVYLLFLSSACSKGSTEPLAESQSSRTSAAPSAGEATESPDELQKGPVQDVVLRKWTGDLDGMIQRRIIRVLTTYSKTGYFVDGATQRGLTYDAFRLFEDDLNKKLKNKNIRVHVVMLPMAHDELIPALLEGRGDIVASSLMITDARKDQVDFANPSRSGVSAIVVTGPGAPPINRVDDLADREVYIRLSMTNPQGVQRFNDDLAKKGLRPVKIRPAPEVLADEDILEMVNAGMVQTTVMFDYIAEFWQQVFPNLVLNRGAAVKTDGQIAWAIRKNSPQLKAELNALLARYPEGSLQRNLLLQKYLKSVKYAKNATSQSERAKFELYLGFFRQYSERYGLDYLLMMAQGYQESQLDQNAKSTVGAIGVMQLMPATGKEMRVGDITQIEPNIHAGVKYIRFMMDQYYADEPMDRLNKGLFTFASYNAGPARINRLRQQAAKRGLDPNKWFNNVEVLAAESIGRETVQYVSNIFKYYLAYQMVLEEKDRQLKAKEAAKSQK